MMIGSTIRWATRRLVLGGCILMLASATVEAARWGANYFPDLPVTSQLGKTYRFYSDLIKGRIVAINFFYTNCRDICGLQTARMAIVQDLLGDRLGKDVFIYSISLDPKHDRPDVLKQYADAFGAKPGWLFLTGDPDDLHKIRYKLGERSRSLAEHRNDAVLGNDKTGEWGRSSIMANLNLLAQNIIEMDPVARETRRPGRLKYAQRTARHYKLGNHKGQALFLKACAACHSIGMGRRVGPDLEGVTARRDGDWLTSYLLAPDRMRRSGDPIAVALNKRFKGVLMPNLSLGKNDVSDLISYIETETKRLRGTLAKSEAHGSHKH